MNEQTIRRRMTQDDATYDEIYEALQDWANDEYDRQQDRMAEEQFDKE